MLTLLVMSNGFFIACLIVLIYYSIKTKTLPIVNMTRKKLKRNELTNFIVGRIKQRPYKRMELAQAVIEKFGDIRDIKQVGVSVGCALNHAKKDLGLPLVHTHPCLWSYGNVVIKRKETEKEKLNREIIKVISAQDLKCRSRIREFRKSANWESLVEAKMYRKLSPEFKKVFIKELLQAKFNKKETEKPSNLDFNFSRF